MSITDTDVRHVATLARLGLDDARIPSLVAELNGILGHMDVLQAVALSPETSDEASPRPMPLRADVPGAVALDRAREAFAPAMRDGFFLVPRVATHGAVGAAGSPASSTMLDDA